MKLKDLGILSPKIKNDEISQFGCYNEEGNIRMQDGYNIARKEDDEVEIEVDENRLYEMVHTWTINGWSLWSIVHAIAKALPTILRRKK